jgi:MarR family transcriptional regulator, transcriptional regulator for hemolysin
MGEAELIQLFMDTWRLLARRFRRITAESGFSMTDGLVLFKVNRTPAGCKASEIAAHLGLTPSTITGIMDRLESGGWITRGPDPADRRAHLMRGTPKLAKLMEDSGRSLDAEMAATLAPLPPELLPRLISDLSAVRDLMAAEALEERK